MMLLHIRRLALALLLCAPLSGIAQETVVSEPATRPPEHEALRQQVAASAKQALTSTKDRVDSMMETGLGFLGIRYRRGGSSLEAGGFDCSGFVKKVVASALNFHLPRTSAEMAKVGDQVEKRAMRPGDLVFFNTMNRAFSHVGIYLGNSQFLHSPRPGGAVRVENMELSYWQKRFNGARRLIDSEAESPTEP